MSKYPTNWLVTDYIQTFIQATGKRPNDEEGRFIEEKLCYIIGFNDMKKLYYSTVYELDFYPRWFILFFLRKKLRKILTNLEAPQSIIDIDKEFANLILHQSIRAYTKYKSSDLKNHFDM